MGSLLQQRYNWLKDAAQMAIAELCNGPGCGECKWRDLCDECGYYEECIGLDWRNDEIDQMVAEDRGDRRRDDEVEGQ